MAHEPSVIRVELHEDPRVLAAIAELRRDMWRGLIAILRNQGVEVGALEDLQAADAELAATVTDLVAGIDRIDTDFAALQAAIGTEDQDAIEAEAEKVQASLQALKDAKARIDATDPVPAAPPADTPPATDPGTGPQV